jgi:hypothetical protein
MSSPARFALIVAAYFAVLVVALFGMDLLWKPRSVVSGADQDIDRQFYPWRDFAFREWRSTGRPPLWNPYAFGGVPALGNPQYGLFYPPNWLHFFLPTGWAINLIAAFHFWLAGLLTASWCRSRGASTVACLVGGTIFALSGPVMLHLYAGHLTYLCAVAWTPAIFMACDRIVERRGTGSILLGATMVAMQFLAGYPQPVFYTAILVVPYVTAHVWFSVEPRRVRAGARALATVAAMYLLGAALAGAQLFPALAAARESVRATPLDFAQASTYALPLENLLTLIVPYPFGDDFSSPYRGKWLMWETSVFVGGVAVKLAACGVLARRGRARRDLRAAAIVLGLAIVLALGGVAFHALYTVVPGVDRFRAPGRFAFLAALMLSALAAAGIDALRESRVSPHVRLLLAALAGAAAAALWTRFPVAAIAFTQVAAFLALAGRAPRLVYVVPLLLLLEMWRPAARAVDWFTPRPVPAMLPPRWPDQRYVQTSATMLNQSVAIGIEDAWGYDPATSARWTDLVGPLLGAGARQGDFTPTRDLAETRNDPLWRMIRVDNGDAPPLPRLLLIDHVRRVDNPAASLAAVRAEDFDPTRVVVVEASEELLRPYGITHGEGPIGDVTVVRRTTDSLEIIADVSRGAMLLVTDAYSAGWRVRPFDFGPEPVYAIPANHALRGVPLAAGTHHIVMEYRPPTIAIGRLVTLAAAVVTVCLVVRSLRKRERSGVPDPVGAPPVL